MTRLLLDSHVFVWFVAGSDRVSARARNAIEQAANDVWVSYASIWELAIKQSATRLQLPALPDEMAAQAAMKLLPIELRHIRGSTLLPPIHGDPFDRLIVAQAIEEGLVLVTADRAIQRYPVAWLW
jgi:PIN domain nuclease of toxin-antitoxin system